MHVSELFRLDGWGGGAPQNLEIFTTVGGGGRIFLKFSKGTFPQNSLIVVKIPGEISRDWLKKRKFFAHASRSLDYTHYFLVLEWEHIFLARASRSLAQF